MSIFIDGKEERGLLYDLRAIKKVYDSLGIPKEFFQLPWSALSNDKIIIELSERSTGKTTNWLLFGLCMNKLYGTVIQYIRATENMLSPSFSEKLVEVIRSYKEGEYIKKLTDGKYNSIYYHWRQYFYCLVEDGKIIEKSEEPIIQCLSVDRNHDYKSSYNSYKNRGDLIIFDEFIGKYYRPNEFVEFMDLTKTIIRDRHSPIIVMLANTINLNSFYFEEMEISREVRRLKKGDKKEIITEGGTRIYVEIVLDDKRASEKRIVNNLFYGFKNPKLASITGGEVWAFENVPHIPDQTNKVCLLNNLYLESGIDLLKIGVYSSDELDTHLEIHRATKTYDDSIILTLGELKDKRYIFGIGRNFLKKILVELIRKRHVYYSSNEVGSIFKDYLNRYRLEKDIY